MKAIYTEEQARRIRERKERIESVTKNRTACARRKVEEYKELKELERLENEWIDYE